LKESGCFLAENDRFRIGLLAETILVLRNILNGYLKVGGAGLC